MTPEQIHDALNLLPSDLITETDSLRTQPRKKPLVLRRWVATAACAALVLMLGSFAVTHFPPDRAKTSESIAEAPAAAAPEAPVAENAPAEIRQEAPDMDTIVLTPTGEPEEAPTKGTASGAGRDDSGSIQESLTDWHSIRYLSTPVLPAVNTFGDPRTALITGGEALENYRDSQSAVFDMEAFSGNMDQYNNAWFLENDLLILRIGAPSPEFRYEVTGFVRQPDTEPAAWQITLARNPDEPTDIAFDNSSMWHILIPVPKGTMPEDAVILIDFA